MHYTTEKYLDKAVKPINLRKHSMTFRNCLYLNNGYDAN
jgi:hypothetical protein